MNSDDFMPVKELLNIKDASIFVSNLYHRNITPSNISYLIQYGRVSREKSGSSVLVYKDEIIKYFEEIYSESKKQAWQQKLGKDLNWELSFDKYKESETTKHVHRLHPYKGKFIPQLVEYFLDSHTDDFKKEVYFKEGDIVIDPFCGSGTTLVQASELGINAVGVDISAFNTLISNVKVDIYDFESLEKTIAQITSDIQNFVSENNINEFEKELMQELNKFNNLYFPTPEFRYKVRNRLVDETKYGKEKTTEFLLEYYKLVDKFNIKLKQKTNQNFLDKWYLETVRKEIDFAFNLIKQIKDPKIKRIVTVILSRTIRSCRATTHADLATLKEPVIETYYCSKHGKICKPIFSILGWWKRYAKDTLTRLKTFEKLRTKTFQFCLQGDSRNIDIIKEVEVKNPDIANILSTKKAKGIFSSPPYVGLIDYHEQHAYAYDLFGFERKDELEIGPLYKGQGLVAKESYIEGISKVLNNMKKFLVEDFDIFLVANDKYGLYPKIAQNCDMQIVNQYKRPVLNRTEKDKGAYSEIIFHFKSL